jgi:hypothetical protein
LIGKVNGLPFIHAQQVSIPIKLSRRLKNLYSINRRGLGKGGHDGKNRDVVTHDNPGRKVGQVCRYEGTAKPESINIRGSGENPRFQPRLAREREERLVPPGMVEPLKGVVAYPTKDSGGKLPPGQTQEEIAMLRAGFRRGKVGTERRVGPKAIGSERRGQVRASNPRGFDHVTC